jgi:mono/diheme cytochrome c family protein
MRRARTLTAMLPLVVFVVLFLAPVAFAQSGEELYQSNCAACHGADGTGIIAHSLAPTFTCKSPDHFPMLPTQHLAGMWRDHVQSGIR